MQARVELRCFSEEHFPGVLEVEKAGKNIYTQQAEELSPFERTSFEPLLQVAVAQLDARGSYLPDRAVNGEKQPVRELYFPLPFNDEQVQIIQRLDGHDGVVFSSAITTLAAGIQSTNRAEAEQEITQFGEDLNRLHGSLARIDRELAEWAARNTDPLQIEGETLTPLEAAEQVIAGEGLYEWLTDELTLDPA
nr:hypothetical protein [Tanacetum cinerariifolium]